MNKHHIRLMNNPDTSLLEFSKSTYTVGEAREIGNMAFKSGRKMGMIYGAIAGVIGLLAFQNFVPFYDGKPE